MAMRISRLLITGVAVGTIVGTARFFSTTPMSSTRPGRLMPASMASRPWGRIAGSQLLALWLTWRPGQRSDDEDCPGV